MNKKTVIILIVLLVVGGAAFGGYKYYRYYMQKKQPNNDLPPFSQEVIPTPNNPNASGDYDDNMARAKEPEFKDVTADAKSLYPSLSGKYEPIWDEYEEIPINILALGSETLTASYKMIWSKKYLYVQVKIKDSTPDTTGENYGLQDSVEFFINEDGNKNSTLMIGDAHYIVNRKNIRTSGFGTDPGFESVTYELGTETDADGYEVNAGYIVEAVIPLVTIKASKNNSIGFDIQINDAVDGSLVSIYKWASDYLYTFQNFAALGTLTFK